MKRKRPNDEPEPQGPQQEAQPPQQEAPAPEPDEHPPAAERDDLLARLQRVSADYLNYQKRVQRDLAQAREFANEDLIKALLSVLDDMERALEAARANHGEDDPLLTGMQLVHDNALTTLGRFGLASIDAQSQPFDPEKHSAVQQMPSADHPAQTVVQELQKGYTLKGRTIRPSMVVVSTGSPADDQASQGYPNSETQQ